MTLCRLYKSDAPPEDAIVDVASDRLNIAVAIGIGRSLSIESKTLARFEYVRSGRSVGSAGSAGATYDNCISSSSSSKAEGGRSEVWVELFMDDSACASHPMPMQNASNPNYRGDMLLVVTARHADVDGGAVLYVDYTDLYAANKADAMVRIATHEYREYPTSAAENAAAKRIAQRVRDMHAL
jgi:hypothetical protein